MKSYEKWKSHIEKYICKHNHTGGATAKLKKDSPLSMQNINAGIGEVNTYRILMKHGHYILMYTNHLNAGGPDFITYYHYGNTYNKNIGAMVDNAFRAGRIVGRFISWPDCIVTVPPECVPCS